MKNQPFIPVDITEIKLSEATFEIETVFKITRRGLIFVGKIKNGTLYLGDIISFSFNNEMYYRKITGIEIASRIKGSKNDRTGILIQTINEEEIDHLKTWQPNNYIANIYQLSNDY